MTTSILFKQCNYMDIPILLHNASYTFASYIKRTEPETIVKTLKNAGLISQNEVFNNDDCEDCDDDPLPLDKINPK